MIKLLGSILLTAMAVSADAQDSILLYANSVPPGAIAAPNNESQIDRSVAGGGILATKVSVPALTVFLPPRGTANGTAVLICPGGGYTGLSISKEGYLVAKELNKLGITAFVLKYRLPDEKIMKDMSIGPLQDAQTAIQIIRRRAGEWNINSNKVGIMGFSAGGHLAATAGTHFNKAVISNTENINLRPDFMVLMYPVISFQDSLTHMGSRNALLGANPSASLKTEFSNEMQVTPQTPPTLLVHAENDKTVNVENSIRFYEALSRNGVPAELLLFPKGGHGFGLHNTTTTDNWVERCRDWMKSNGWL